MFNRLKDIFAYHRSMCEMGETGAYAAAPICGLVCGLGIGFWLSLAFLGVPVAVLLCTLGGGLVGLLIGDMHFLLIDLPAQLRQESMLQDQLLQLHTAVRRTRETALDHVCDKDAVCAELDQMEQQLQALDKMWSERGITAWLLEANSVAAKMPGNLVIMANLVNRLINSRWRPFGPYVCDIPDDPEAHNECFRQNLALWEQMIAESERLRHSVCHS